MKLQGAGLLYAIVHHLHNIFTVQRRTTVKN